MTGLSVILSLPVGPSLGPSMTAPAPVPARAMIEILGLRHASELECFGDVLVEGLLQGLNHLLGVEEALRHRVAQKRLPPLLEVSDLLHVQHHAAGLFVLQDCAPLTQFTVLFLGLFVGQEHIDLLPQHLKVGLIEDGLAKFSGLLCDRAVWEIGYHGATLNCLRVPVERRLEPAWIGRISKLLVAFGAGFEPWT